jgi:hypothetical protein
MRGRGKKEARKHESVMCYIWWKERRKKGRKNVEGRL